MSWNGASSGTRDIADVNEALEPVQLIEIADFDDLSFLDSDW